MLLKLWYAFATSACIIVILGLYLLDNSRRGKPWSYLQNDYIQNDYIPKFSGSVILYTKLNTGSTFTGSFFLNDRTFYYSFEPIYFNEDKPYDVLNATLHCNFSTVWDHFRGKKTTYVTNMKHRNNLDWFGKRTLCDKLSRRQCDTLNKTFHYKYCSSFNYRAIKVIRVPLLQSLEPFMKENVKVIHVVRDPRGVAASRADGACAHHLQEEGNRKKCKIKPYGENYPETKAWGGIVEYCTAIRHDLEYISKLFKTNPKLVRSNYYFLRYEDLALDPFVEVKSLYNFLGIEPDHSIMAWMRKTFPTEQPKQVQRKPNVRSKKRNKKPSFYALHKWRTKLSFPAVSKIQHQCQEIMEILGYYTVSSEEELTSSQSLIRPHKHPLKHVLEK